jgi:methyl-accepting chemotaxis protein
MITPSDRAFHLRRLLTFTAWTIPVVIGVTLIQVVLLFFWFSPPVLMTTAAVGAFGVAVATARSALEQEDIYAATNILAISMLVLALAVVLAIPALLPAVVFLPIMAIITILPVVETFVLQRWIIATWVMLVIAVVLGEFVTLFEPPSPGIVKAIQLLCIVPGAGLTLLLMYQFHCWITSTLANAKASNEQLNSVRTELEHQVEQLEQAQEMQVAKQYLEQVVAEYSRFADRVAKGDLTTRLVIEAKHEDLAVLGHSLNQMVESLNRMITHTKRASNAISEATEQILAAATNQAASTAQKTAAITQTTTTVDEVKTIVLQVSQQSNMVAQESQGAVIIARRGSDTVKQTVSSMRDIQERVQSIAQTILSLSEQTQAIGTITATVSELADQSNLLALNAAIEAARAGEQGKSFAVVAQHVRELAERSKAATRQVQNILDEIQKATNTSVMVTEEGTKGVEEGTKLANQAGEVIDRVTYEIESGAQSNIQMASSSSQALTGVKQIGRAMKSIQQATGEMVSSMRQTEAAAKDLNGLAQSLQETIQVYRLNEE